MKSQNVKSYATLLILAAMFLAVAFYSLHSSKPTGKQLSPAEAKATPQVLGDSTSIRGEQSRGVFAEPFWPIKQPDLQKISAESWLVYDSETGQILSAKNENKQLPIASLTKIITGLVAYDNLDFSSTISVGPGDEINITPTLRLRTGDEVKVNDLFEAMMVGSANDAALALANHTEKATGRKFTDLMNLKASALGMLNSNFGNPMGFDYGKNYSTANDLKLAVQATNKLAAFTGLGRRMSKIFSGAMGKEYRINSTNKLLKNYPELEAVKTGYTESSKGSLIVKAAHKGRSIVYILIGSNFRERDFTSLKSEIEASFVLPE